MRRGTDVADGKEHADKRQRLEQRRRKPKSQVVPLPLLDENVNLILGHLLGQVVGLMEVPRRAERLDGGRDEDADDGDEVEREEDDYRQGQGRKDARVSLW